MKECYIEQLIKQKAILPTVIMKMMSIGLIVITVLFWAMTELPLLFALIIIVLAVMMYKRTNLEYEYCFTNGALDVDKVINMRSRKRLLEVNARKIDMMASNKNREFKRYLDDRTTKKVYACTHIDDEGVYFVIFPGKDGRTMLLFNPNDKIKEGFRRYNPQKVTLDD